jgi:hypothetical protein
MFRLRNGKIRGEKVLFAIQWGRKKIPKPKIVKTLKPKRIPKPKKIKVMITPEQNKINTDKLLEDYNKWLRANG